MPQMFVVARRRISTVLVASLCAVAIVFVFPSVASAASPPSCDQARLASWRRVRNRLREALESYAGRIPFSSLYEDREMVDVIAGSLDEVNANAHEAEAIGTECQIGRITVHLFSVLSQISGPAQEMSARTQALLPEVVQLPWVEVLLGGWPVFTILGLIARWVRLPLDKLKVPYSFGRARIFSAPVKDASADAFVREAQLSQVYAACDRAEMTAMSATRRIFSERWRRRSVVTGGTREPGDADDALVNSFLEFEVPTTTKSILEDPPLRACRWTKHDGFSVGGLLEGVDELLSTLDRAKAACEADSRCAGISAHGASSSNSSAASFRLRSDRPSLQWSVDPDVVAYIAWRCTADPGPSLVPAVHLNQCCPFGRAAALLASALCRLGGPSCVSDVTSHAPAAAHPVTDFAPELVIETRELLVSWLRSLEEHGADILAGARDMFLTEWPVWDLLDQLQQRVDLSLVSIGGEAQSSHEPGDRGDGQDVSSTSLLRGRHAASFASQPTWIAVLQQALGLDDEAWRHVTSELQSLAERDLALVGAEPGPSVPQKLRETIQCMGGEQCVGEFFGRLLLLLRGGGRLPIRDSITIGPQDALAAAHFGGSHFLSKRDFTEEEWLLRGAAIYPDSIEESVPREILDVGKRPRTPSLSAMLPASHPLQIDRLQFSSFVLEARDLIGSHSEGNLNLGRCLEWDEPLVLLRAFAAPPSEAGLPFCRWIDRYTYSEPDDSELWKGLAGRHQHSTGVLHLWGDISFSDERRHGIESATYGLIVCPFVFEHVAQPFVAMQNLARSLRPGGFLLWAAPMFQQYHGAPHDYFRYTPKGARTLAASAGLEVLRLYAPGDIGLTIGIMMGLLSPYWTSSSALSEEAPRPGEDEPTHPLNIFMLLRRPLS
eukprot:TRINITY_DN55335_c0_g1_i1.p1 TRINITY_DN55335_c0_g1~~TRINITY_DN55335_c0_g1_i1.p1  ORF type:complete len:891 (+),score=77.56 TRINITY_DN55335_c0_g1_i1:64-2736(+)